MSSTPPLKGCLAALLTLCAAPASAAPIITEFLTNNNTGILDEDMTRQDWIEVYNPDLATVDLGGYHLTDDSGLPTRWTFPSGVMLNPGQYLVVFASGKNRTVPGSNLHTNFSLASGGEYLALNAPGGTPALSEWNPFYPAQSGDISYGLLNPVAGSGEGFFTVPTPGAVNNAANSPAETVLFSEPSKTFNQGTTFPVTLSTPSGTATIRYTINRAMPIAVDGVAPTVGVDAATDVWTSTVPHTFKDGDQVQVHSTSTMPGGMGLGLDYYVTVLSPTTFKLADDPGGLIVDATSAGAGVIHVRRHAAQWTQTANGTTIPIPNHRFYTGDAVQVSTTGTLPAPLVAGTIYYVLNNFAFSTNLNNITLSAAPNSTTAISITNVGTGVQTMRRIPSPVASAPLTINHSLRLRARSFEAGRPDGAPVSASYLMLDAAAQAFTSNIPVMVLHSFGSGHPSTSASNPEDTKQSVWFTFEPKPEGTPPTVTNVTRLTNAPDLVTPAYFERRGSSTFGALKYSMTMGAFNELAEGGSVSPLGFASNDDFVLNAHFEYDRSLMHNDLAYRLSREAGQWAPETRHVEVFMSVGNDVVAAGSIPAYGVVTGAVTGADYYGVYSFQDKISRGTNRLDIEKLEPFHNTAPEVQGGYVFKIDRLDIGDSGVAAAGRSFPLVQPKERTTQPANLLVATAQQKTYLANTLNAMNAALNGPTFMDPLTGYAAHLDVPAAIDHWWLSILPKSADAFRLSGFWHKARFGKLVMGPVFDFDRAMGSTDGRDLNPRTWRGDVGDLGTDYFHSATIYSPNYFERMFSDPNYWQATIDRYEALRKTVLSTAHVHAIVDEWTELLDPGNLPNIPANSSLTPARRNFQKFAGFPPRGVSASTLGTNGTFRGETEWLKNWWGKAGAVVANGRFDFVDGQFTRPPVPSIPEGPVPGGSSVTLTSPSLSITGTKIYYTTNGTDPRLPATAPQTLFSPGAAATLGTLMPDIGPVRGIVPNSATVGGATGVEWRGTDTNGNGNNADDFDDSGWFTNTSGSINGVGYDDDIAAVSYLPHISLRWSTPGTPIAPNNNTNTMRNTNGSCFARWTFTLTAADIALATTAGNQLVLNARYDDGFVAWLNGTRVAFSDNVPAPDSTAWNTVLGTSREANLPAGFDFSITPNVGLLHVGTNVLAIQAINGSNTGSSDLVMQPRIVVKGPPGGRPAATPELTGAAQEYTTAFTITAPTQIFARTFIPLLASDPPTQSGGGTGDVPNGSSWSAPTVLYFFPGAVAASQASIQITEVQYHPLAPAPDEVLQGWTNSNDFEFIRLTNTGASPVDLTGIYFSNGLEFTAAPGLQNWLPAGASVVVVENTAAFISRYGTSFTILGEFTGELDDGGEHIVLNDKTGAVISDFIYGDGNGLGDTWPTLPDTGGHSLLYVSGNQSLPASWRVSLDPGGTAVNTFARWQRRYFENGDIPSEGMAADNDGDGLNNLGEYAAGTDPRRAGTAEQAIALAITGQPGRASFRRRTGTTDVTWIFESSTDLGATWAPIGGAPVSTVPNGDDTETVTYDAPGAPGAVRVFIRARMTSP